MTLSEIPQSNLDMVDRLESGKELTQVERAYICGFLHAIEMAKNIKFMRSRSTGEISIIRRKDYEETEK
jgi:hypothetical protein